MMRIIVQILSARDIDVLLVFIWLYVMLSLRRAGRRPYVGIGGGHLGKLFQIDKELESKRAKNKRKKNAKKRREVPPTYTAPECQIHYQKLIDSL